MLYVSKRSTQCCGTCEHWNGVRVREDDGHVYSLGNVEAVCRKLCGTGDNGRGIPLTLPSAPACPEYEGWQKAGTDVNLPEPHGANWAFWQR